MAGKDRNTLLLIVIILVISIVSFIVVLTLAWRVTGDSIMSVVNFFIDNVEVRRTDYNFEVPETE